MLVVALMVDARRASPSGLVLDPDYAVAMFNHGGVHWNSGDRAMGEEVWTVALERFPDHELCATLKRDLSPLFGGPAIGQCCDKAC